LVELLSGLFYGYPYCWSQYNLTTGKPPGTQWATDKFIKDGTHTYVGLPQLTITELSLMTHTPHTTI
jgi:hypothetical protein